MADIVVKNVLKMLKYYVYVPLFQPFLPQSPSITAVVQRPHYSENALSR